MDYKNKSCNDGVIYELPEPFVQLAIEGQAFAFALE